MDDQHNSSQERPASSSHSNKVTSKSSKTKGSAK